MRASDEAKQIYLDALAAVLGPDCVADFKVELDCIERRYFREFDQRVLYMEAARLLPLGAEVVAIRQSRHRSTIYRRAERGREIVALLLHGATKPA